MGVNVPEQAEQALKCDIRLYNSVLQKKILNTVFTED